MNKKSLVAAAFLALAAAYPAQAQQGEYAESAKRDLYDFSKYEMLEMLKFFKDLDDKGRKFPTREEFKNKFGVDPELVRSHVRKREVLKGEENPYLFKANKQITREDRHLWMNIPMGLARDTGGYISNVFDNDPYTMWQYTELFGSWNHGFFQAPGSWADAAHKHGADLMSGIVFFDTTGNAGGTGSSAYERDIINVLNSKGERAYVKPLIHILMYLGLDGINYNWEDGSYKNNNVVTFHRALRKYAKEVGFTNFRQGVYTHLKSGLTGPEDSYATSWLWDKAENHFVGDIALNYSASDFSDINGHSGNHAKQLTGSYDHLYTGAWIVSMDPMRRAFSRMEKVQTNLWLWGEHANSRFVTNNTGKTGTEKMANYQKLYERAFSGGSRNVGHMDSWSRPTDWGDQLASFGGLSRMIPERTTLKQDLPFRTYFNTGTGERYFYKGKSSTGSWYNLSSQDYQPTYRWLQYAEGTQTATLPILAEFHYDDAYLGGTSLRINIPQDGSAGQDLILYRGLLKVSAGNVVAKLALKSGDEKKLDPHLSLLLHKKGAPATEYIEVAANKLAGKTWEEQEFKVAGLQKGDVIDFIGLRVKKGASVGHNLLVGGISIFDDAQGKAPKAPKNLHAEVKAETTHSLSALLTWEAEAVTDEQTRKDFGLLYNDEAGVDHFQVFYKNGKDGKVREIARTTTWAAYAPMVKFSTESDAANAEVPYYGVRAVGKDLKSVSDITWIPVERASSAFVPPYKDDRYCKSEIDKKADGYKTAIAIRYLTDVTTNGATTDLKYKATGPDTDGDNYVDATNVPFVVQQGQSLEFFFKAHGEQTEPGTPTRDGLQWCWAATYIDWNNNGSFEPEEDEAISQLDLGEAKKATPAFQKTGVTKTFQVPDNAAPGTVRVRIVFTDAWFPKPTPCGVTAKGFTIDFNMKIEGDPNKARKYKDHRDAGEPEQPEMPTPNPGSVEDVVEGGKMFGVYPNPATDVLNFHNAERAWIFSLEGVLVRFVSDATVPANISDLPAGTYVVKTEQARVTRSHKFVKK